MLECERQQLWIGVVRHVDRLLASGASIDLIARRAQANSELKAWQAAKADYSKALAGDGSRWEWLAGRAEAEAALGQRDEALADYSKAIERKGDRAELWSARGRLEAERGDWRKAAADLGKAIHLGDEQASTWSQHVLALLAGGDEANYRRSCGRLLDRFGTTKDESTLRRIVWTVALVEGMVRDWKPLLEAAKQRLAANPKSAELRRQLAILSCRASQFDAAIQLLRPIQEGDHPESQARDWLVMALAAQRLGHKDDAKKWLSKAELLRREHGKDNKESWEDRLVYDTLHREAEKLKI